MAEQPDQLKHSPELDFKLEFALQIESAAESFAVFLALLTEKIVIANPTGQSIERGETNVTISTLTAMAAAYGISMKSFFHAPPDECECA